MLVILGPTTAPRLTPVSTGRPEPLFGSAELKGASAPLTAAGPVPGLFWTKAALTPRVAPAFTVTLVVSTIWLLVLSRSVPPLTVVRPV